MKKKEQPLRSNARRRYDAEFKASAVRMIENGRRVSEVSQALGVSESLLNKWRSAARSASPGDNNSEVEVLRKQVKQLEMERDILKKALSIFSRTT